MYRVLNKLSEFTKISEFMLTFTYQKTWVHTLCCLFLKSSKAFSVSLSISKFLSFWVLEACHSKRSYVQINLLHLVAGLFKYVWPFKFCTCLACLKQAARYDMRYSGFEGFTWQIWLWCLLFYFISLLICLVFSR